MGLCSRMAVPFCNWEGKVQMIFPSFVPSFLLAFPSSFVSSFFHIFIGVELTFHFQYKTRYIVIAM